MAVCCVCIILYNSLPPSSSGYGPGRKVKQSKKSSQGERRRIKRRRRRKKRKKKRGAREEINIIHNKIDNGSSLENGIERASRAPVYRHFWNWDFSFSSSTLERAAVNFQFLLMGVKKSNGCTTSGKRREKEAPLFLFLYMHTRTDGRPPPSLRQIYWRKRKKPFDLWWPRREACRIHGIPPPQSPCIALIIITFKNKEKRK